jgi:hypothetical protein
MDQLVKLGLKLSRLCALAAQFGQGSAASSCNDPAPTAQGAAVQQFVQNPAHDFGCPAFIVAVVVLRLVPAPI